MVLWHQRCTEVALWRSDTAITISMLGLLEAAAKDSLGNLYTVMYEDILSVDNFLKYRQKVFIIWLTALFWSKSFLFTRFDVNFLICWSV